MTHALTVLAVLWFAGSLAGRIPIPVLAAILLVVAWHMGEWREIPDILKLSKAAVGVWLITFSLTVFADLTVAVQAGMILAALMFIRKISVTTTVSEVTPDDIRSGTPHAMVGRQIPDYVRVFRIHGPFLFGTTDKLEAIADRIPEMPPVVVLRLRNMTALDATGLQAFEDLADRLHRSERVLILCGARSQPTQLMKQAEFDQRIGHENICPSIEAALARARDLVERAEVAEPPGRAL